MTAKTSSIHELLSSPKRNGIQGSHFAPKPSVISTCLTYEKRPNIMGSKGLSPLAGFQRAEPFGGVRGRAVAF